MNSLDHYDDDPDQAFVKQADRKPPRKVSSTYGRGIRRLSVLMLIAVAFIIATTMVISQL